MKLDGWAIEARVYAEDPYRGFLPSTGRLISYQPPIPVIARSEATSNPAKAIRIARSLAMTRCVRVDDGVVEGGEVSMFYDPMIAKLISWAPTREEAIDEQVVALDAFQIDGHRRQYRFPLRAAAAPALPLRQPHHRLHRRGISRRVHTARRRTRS